MAPKRSSLLQSSLLMCQKKTHICAIHRNWQLYLIYIFNFRSSAKLSLRFIFTQSLNWVTSTDFLLSFSILFSIFFLFSLIKTSFFVEKCGESHFKVFRLLTSLLSFPALAPVFTVHTHFIITKIPWSSLLLVREATLRKFTVKVSCFFVGSLAAW